MKYRADKPLAELIDLLQKVCGSVAVIAGVNYTVANRDAAYRKQLALIMISGVNTLSTTKSSLIWRLYSGNKRECW